ncbi:hypothetical protein NL676_003996 [Syzygium grande]|nr:hypothetical protein NL676_003996 [Syzygium grande]
MEARGEAKKTTHKPRSRLPPKRGQVKVRIFKLLANQIAKLAENGARARLCEGMGEMVNREEAEKTAHKPESRLPPRRGQVKVRIFKLLADQIVKLAKTVARMLRKACCCDRGFDSGEPPEDT